MKTKITKLTAVVALILIAVLCLTVFDKTVTPAWAIEDTVRALENVHSIKMSGVVSDINESGESVEGDFILWAKPNTEGTESKELRIETSGQTTVVSPSGTAFMYHPNQNIVYETTNPKAKIDPWMGSKFFHDIKKFAEKWKVTYGEDEETGKDSIFVTFIYTAKSKSWWFQFDSETKLPLKFKQWTNISFEGKPEFYAESIEYNPELPEGIFEFKIPEGAKVVHVPMKIPQYFNDPNVGISTEGLTDTDASLLLVEDYWRAIIDGNWEYLAQLRPISNAKEWEIKFKRNENWPMEVLEIGQPSRKENCNIGPVISCKVKYSNKEVKNIQLVIKFRNIDGVKSCVIAGTYGGTKDFER